MEVDSTTTTMTRPFDLYSDKLNNILLASFILLIQVWLSMADISNRNSISAGDTCNKYFKNAS